MALSSRGKLIGMAACIEKVALRQEFEDAYWKQQEIRRKNRDRFEELLDEIACLDPNGWSKWYDDNIPDFISWDDTEKVLQVLNDRWFELSNHEHMVAETSQEIQQ